VISDDKCNSNPSNQFVDAVYVQHSATTIGSNASVTGVHLVIEPELSEESSTNVCELATESDVHVYRN